MRTTIIVISGHAGSGKDTTAKILREYFEDMEAGDALVTHFADLLKYICKTYLSWNGEKDAFGRSLLQHIGTDVIRKQNQNYWVDFVCDMLNFFEGRWKYVIIADTRFPNEITRLEENGYKVIHVRIERDTKDFLNKSQQAHESETSLDDYKHDFLLVNNGSLEELKGKIRTVAEEIETMLDDDYVMYTGGNK